MRNLNDTITRLAALRARAATGIAQAGNDRLEDLPAFGSNPGALRGRYFVPEGLGENAALVVVLHGCTQTAAGYDLGSGWSQGLVPIDTLARLEADRGVPVEVDRSSTLDWDALRAKVRGGVRNATLMAIAPTASIGLVAGVGLALLLMRFMRALLYEVEPTDPVSVAGVVIVLALVAAVASWRPARRAMRVDPVSLLRQE